MGEELKQLAKCFAEDFLKHGYTSTEGNISKVESIQIDTTVIGSLKDGNNKVIHEIEIELAIGFLHGKPYTLNINATKRVKGKTIGTSLKDSYSVSDFQTTKKGVQKRWRHKRKVYSNSELSKNILGKIIITK